MVEQIGRDVSHHGRAVNGSAVATSFVMLAPVVIPTGILPGNVNDSGRRRDGTAIAVTHEHGLSHRQLDADTRLQRGACGLDKACDNAQAPHRKTAPALSRDR